MAHLAAAHDQYLLVPHLPGEDERASTLYLGEVFVGQVLTLNKRTLVGDARCMNARGYDGEPEKKNMRHVTAIVHTGLANHLRSRSHIDKMPLHVRPTTTSSGSHLGAVP